MRDGQIYNSDTLEWVYTIHNGCMQWKKHVTSSLKRY